MLVQCAVLVHCAVLAVAVQCAVAVPVQTLSVALILDRKLDRKPVISYRRLVILFLWGKTFVLPVVVEIHLHLLKERQT